MKKERKGKKKEERKEKEEDGFVCLKRRRREGEWEDVGPGLGWRANDPSEARGVSEGERNQGNLAG